MIPWNKGIIVLLVSLFNSSISGLIWFLGIIVFLKSFYKQ